MLTQLHAPAEALTLGTALQQNAPPGASNGSASPLARLDARSEAALKSLRPNLLGCTQAEMADLFVALGLPTFRAKQVFNALFARRVESFLSMTELSRPLRETLQQQFDLGRPRIDACQVSVDGTRKYRFVAADGTAFESVYIPEVGGKRTNTLDSHQHQGASAERAAGWRRAR